MRKREWVLGATVTIMIAMVLLAAGVSSIKAYAEQSAATSPEVQINNAGFGPATLTVAVGTTVTWVNRDDVPHTTVSSDKVFKSRLLDTDKKFSYTFTKAGAYPYFCSIHPKMTGTIVVQ
jgi:plastocyanin